VISHRLGVPSDTCRPHSHTFRVPLLRRVLPGDSWCGIETFTYGIIYIFYIAFIMSIGGRKSLP